MYKENQYINIYSKSIHFKYLKKSIIKMIIIAYFLITD